jgi:hypothetical protein
MKGLTRKKIKKGAFITLFILINSVSWSQEKMNLEVSFSEQDSIKTITINGTTVKDDKTVPVAGEVVKVYIPGMFSMLNIAEATLDDNGSASVEFPPDLPGDSIGNLNILFRIEESQLYGTVEKSVIQKWGVPTSWSVPDTHRALWTKTPPWWMIITLSILLAGVWGHYMYAVISLILIKKDANRLKNKEEYKL